MTQIIPDKPLTLGGMVLLAQKRAKATLARQTTPSSEDRLSDVVQISAEARQKMTNVRSINNQLDIFRSFLKFLNKR